MPALYGMPTLAPSTATELMTNKVYIVSKVRLLADIIGPKITLESPYHVKRLRGMLL